MNLSQFFSKSAAPDFFTTQSILCFKGSAESYPLLFISLLCTRLKRMQELPILFIDVQDESFPSIQAQLETSFLGQKTIYWLKNCIELDEKKKKQLLPYLANYSGPNVIGIFLPLDIATPAQAQEVIIEPLIDQKTFTEIARFFDAQLPVSSSQLMMRVYKHSQTIPLDTVCLLMHYAKVLGANTDYFISSWLEKIITPEKSLFTLSTYFFAKKAQLFLTEWKNISSQYSEQFWIAFWSEQLWRAHHYVDYSKTKQFALAKKIGYRLPFTFMSRDWQSYNPEELSKAHHYIYEIDSALKNGGNPVGLDLFYSKFFLGEFKQ